MGTVWLNKSMHLLPVECRGLGGAIAQKLQERGDHVTIGDIIDPADMRVTELKTLGFNYVQVDVSNVSSIQVAFDLYLRLIS